MKSILIFGSLPPPIGGVRESVLNLKKSLDSRGIENKIFSIKDVLSFKKFDIGHINFTKKWKVVVAILLAKFSCKKVIFTSHGETFYKNKRYIDRVILFLLDGLIVLNDEVFGRCCFSGNVIKLSPVYKEGFSSIKSISNKMILNRKSDKKYILLYAYGKVFEGNIEIYGCQFIFNLIKKLPKNYILVFVDPKGEYTDDVKSVSPKQIVYLDRYVDFKQLLVESDIYIRPTNFDGNSIATLEALGLGVPVLASDAVERDKSIVLYKTGSEYDFLIKLKYLLENKKKKSDFNHKSIDEYINFCNSIL